MLSGPAIESPQIAELSEEVLEWCRERIALIRCPYGIDQLALAIVCATPGGNPLASTTFGVFRPVDFCNEDGISDRVVEFLREIPLEQLNGELNAGAPGIRFAPALFSWGDVAREAMFEDDSFAQRFRGRRICLDAERFSRYLLGQLLNLATLGGDR
jgi:hypothetical protein